MSEKQTTSSSQDQDISHLETAQGEHETSGVEKVGIDTTNVPRYDDPEVKRIMRKVDWRLVPPLSIFYLLSFMDRSNIGNAKVAGMNKDLGLSGAQYNMALTVFFFTYGMFEVPSNVVLKLMRPSLWMAILVVIWGTILTLQGIVKNYHQLIVTRVLMGLAEAGFFPAATYLLTTWYCRWEVQTRMSVFFAAASMAGAFSGLLAFGIQHMEGVGGLGGWQWIFILEGILTVCLGCLVPFILPDSPNSAKFLTPAEKEVINHRLEQDTGTTAGKVAINDSFKRRYLVSALLDWKIYLGCIIYWGNSICLYGFSFASPTIILDLGYTAAQAQLLTVPIYFVATVATILFAYLADKRQSRWIFILIPFSIAAVGFIALLSIPHPRLPGLTYAFLFTIPAGVYPAVIGCISWVANNLAPTWKRAIGMAVLMTVGNLGGAIGSNIFLDKEKPKYQLGYGFSMGILIAGIISTVIMRYSVARINASRDRMTEEEIYSKYSPEELIEMGDESPLFRYVW